MYKFIIAASCAFVLLSCGVTQRVQEIGYGLIPPKELAQTDGHRSFMFRMEGMETSDTYDRILERMNGKIRYYCEGDYEVISSKYSGLVNTNFSVGQTIIRKKVPQYHVTVICR